MMQNSEICIPLKSLAVGAEEGESSVAPSVGDPVEFTATGTVTRVEGDQAYLALESVNEQPLPKAEPAPEEMDETALMQRAEAEDGEATY